MSCESTNDVIDFYIEDEKIILCVDCRVKLWTSKTSVKSAGRPSLGKTKKVSLTLPEEDWEWIEEQAKGNRSKLLRRLINQEQSPESRWDNNACLGYALLGAKALGYREEDIKVLTRAIYNQFDIISVTEAKEKYNKSPF